ncbi:enoyl-CoA hydratase/isomerase family protein [Mycobacteroides franklinii]|uniref:4-chlorobenzoyl coenzyme A dehalogenase n=1 Tax=Mycobacteroides franklinii TaxID=948102 RepID=A0A4R8R6P3_9MYCO|nr:enoyl-CoA hydratase-related protein [Mycobacteroides franklinii]TDZ42895.1 4-chlorobenzoyl coenzyme A dehalogenase [Mycobacteroides franklinii]TDZ50029.1 4-chlorobenzoyl coenzyme A dehalogenase [Mycobacteroides franklinii]TDZ56450.1 4-chlorobenzoyl coenzyme A dehalogenase [Mycobacteroides franklinii]TDZ63391.1 4-chlorobenzoyl coenzyme A dehalogenase [Mycobacteroides franklinii]TDZ69788.1 4-chlorobenzoyl coenzyme A dehalogenase [Mycobacteroides franklinii]
MSSQSADYVAVHNGVLHITVATAAAGTSLDFAGVDAAVPLLRDLPAEVGAILLNSSGANFCAGGNVRDFASAEDRAAKLDDLAGRLHDFVRAVDAADRPVVASVHGWAAGGGLSLVLLADIAIGGESTKLRAAYPGIGYSSDGGMSWALPRAVGKARAADILLTDRVVEASEALSIGLLSRVVADDEVQATAVATAEKLATGPREAQNRIRRLLRLSANNTLDAQLDLEQASIAEASVSPTGIEGVDAFVGKRKPVWP